MNRFTLVDCATVDDALSQMKGDAVVKAGGIDLLDLMKDGIVSPPKLVSILNVRSLHSIGLSDRGLELGPLTTLSEIAEHPEIQQRYAALSDAAGHAATPQVRNMATLGGNLMQRPRCWYFRSSDFDCRKKGSSDECHALQGENQYHAIVNNKSCAMVHPSSTAVPLLAMDAEVDLQRETAVKPGELITAIRVPSPTRGTRSAYQKYGEKESFDWPLADAGVVLEMDGKTCRRAAIVLGVAAPTPIHATDAEAALRGKVIDEGTAREAGKLAVANATPLSQNGYKVQLFQTAVYRTILLAAGQMGRDPSAVG
jgi:xanthine dehydrogenase YagS FAD-binding subunit